MLLSDAAKEASPYDDDSTVEIVDPFKGQISVNEGILSANLA